MIQLNGRGRILLIVVFLSLLLSSFLVSNNSTVFETTMREDSVTPASGFGTIVIDYSHGQESSIETVLLDDALLGTELEAMGYTVIWARGGLNASILSGADGLLIAAIYGATNVFLSGEIDAIAEWFNGGSKFLWIGCESDYISVPDQGQFINDNMCLILEAVGSHVYPEPTFIFDTESHIVSSYRVVANQTSNDAFVADIVNNVEAVLMHVPTLVYGSDNETNPGVGINPVPLETISLDNVYPLLYYSDFATISDYDITLPIAHDDADVGAFVATTLEINAGATDAGMIITSGASPYADYRSMHTNEYYEMSLNGTLFVTQAIDFCMNSLGPRIDSPADATYEEGQDAYVYSPYEAITWHPNSTSPKCYNITLDDTPIKDGLWNSSSEEISINIEGLLEGIHNYTIRVEDTKNLTAIDTVIVTVLAPAYPVVNHPANITYTEGDSVSPIQWEISDTSLKDYTIYQNDVLQYTLIMWLSNQPISTVAVFPVEGYSTGLYNITIAASDYLDFVTTDTVWVEVLPEPTTTTTTTPVDTTTTTDTTTPVDTTTTTDTTIPTTPVTGGDLLETTTLIISIGSIVVIVIVIVLIKRKT
ncbi:MAG: hypothetical protein RTU63_00825 [Candidatus Thorarchaeota archaeon]